MNKILPITLVGLGLLVGAPSECGAIGFMKIMKDVGEAAKYHFGVTDEDFAAIKRQGFNVVEGNFDICASDEDVQYFLDAANHARLKVILNAGAGEAEWGYPCDENFDPEMRPTWLKDEVVAWVNKWKGHPALWGWDSSNEDGGTFPFSTGGTDPQPDWEMKYALSAAQLQQAYADVKTADPDHPILIRMNGWYFYDYENDFFRPGNVFASGVADIVMVNAYSNVEDYYSDFVTTVMTRSTNSISKIDPKVTMIVSLGVWNEPPIFVTPSVEELVADYKAAMKTQRLVGISFFKYGAQEGEGWYLPDSKRGDPKLWETIRTLMK